MPVEKSAGAVVFRKEKGKIYYLLLHYPSGARTPKDYFDFPKGHLEKGETEIAAAKREIKEETGLTDIEITEGFKEWIKYFFRFKEKNILKFVTFYLARTKEKEVRVSSEHTGYKWLTFKDALAELKFKNAKEILKKADSHLSGQNKRRD